MDWLMCKARGVSKNLISVGNSQSSSSNLTSANSSGLDCDSKKDSSDDKASNNAISYPVFINSFYLKQQLPIISFDSKSLTLSECIQPFPHMDINEWLSAHTIGLFENISTLFDVLYEFCECPNLKFVNEQTMGSKMDSAYLQSLEHFISSHLSATPGITISPSSCARQSIGSILSSCHDIISSKVFPVRYGEHFPADLQARVSGICKKLLICIAHLYLAHFQDLEKMDLIPHMNTMSKHFFLFATKYSLIDDKDVEPLANLHKLLLSTPAPCAESQSHLSKKNSLNTEKVEANVTTEESVTSDH